MITARIVGWLAAAILVTALYLLMSAAHAQTFRDASGRLTGTASRDANGTVTYRDGSGRMIGTAERRRDCPPQWKCNGSPQTNHPDCKCWDAR